MDLFDEESVDEEEAIKFASEVGAVFKLTSARNGEGVENLFKTMGCKFIDNDYVDMDEILRKKSSEKNGNLDNIKLDSEKIKEDNKQNKYCCYYL